MPYQSCTIAAAVGKLNVQCYLPAIQREFVWRPDQVDRLGNLQLLLPHENQAKSDQDFQEWLKSRDQDYRRRHLIPDEPALYDFNKFEEFVQAREELIRQRLRSLLAPVGQPPATAAVTK